MVASNQAICRLFVNRQSSQQRTSLLTGIIHDVVLLLFLRFNPLILNGVFEGNDIEIMIGATVVDVKVFADYYNTDFPYDIHAENRVTLLLKDGTTVQTKVSGVMYDDTIASFVYYMTFVDPADVVSVTFFGTTLVN